MVRTWGKSCEVTSLKTAAAELRRGVEALEGPDDNRCGRCGRNMCKPSVLVADAAQMYEEVPPSRVRDGLSSLIEWARGLGYTGVAVAKRAGGAS